jgi:hypothetical protein
MQLLLALLEAKCPHVASLCAVLGVPLGAVRRDLCLALFRAGEDHDAVQALGLLPTDLRPSTAMQLFDIARRRLAQSLLRIQSHPRHAHVLVQVDPRMAAWVCNEDGYVTARPALTTCCVSRCTSPPVAVTLPRVLQVVTGWQ